MTLINRIQALHDETNKKYETSKSPYIGRFIDFLFVYPVFTVPMIQSKIALRSRLTAERLISQFSKDKILVQVEGQKGPHGSKLYAFSELLYIIR
jgi:hypothetical protein